VGSHKEELTVVVVSYSGKEINAKLVYYGAGLSGKTTNLESIYEAVPDSSRGKMVSMKTQSDRTLFFDLLPLDLGEIMGFKTRFLLYTVPGQVFYNATRKLVLKGADAIVFVADSEVGKMEENKESLANLRANLAEYGVNLDQMSWVIQYNKRDLPNIYTIDELNAELNPGGKVPFFEAVAKDGRGVFETFRGISHLLMEKVTRDLRRTSVSGAPQVPAIPAEKPAPAPPQPERARLAPPMAPAQTMAREARETQPVEMRDTVGGLDYGREIELPGNTPKAAPHAPAAPAPAPAPAAAPAPAHAPAPRAAVRLAPADAEPAMASAPARTRQAQPAPAPAPTPAPSSFSAPMGNPAPAAAAAHAAAPEAGREKGTLVIPVKIPKSGVQEVVVRILLQMEE
jgi:signal recognition particle receptor subunit beta